MSKKKIIKAIATGPVDIFGELDAAEISLEFDKSIKQLRKNEKAYEDKHGRFDAKILDLNWHVSVSREYDRNPYNNYPLLTVRPNKGDPSDHHHFGLSKKQAKKLRDWLDDYLRDRERIS